MSYSTIENRAFMLLRAHGLDEENKPVDVETLARCLGIRIEKTDLGEDTSAVLIRKDDGTAVIGVHYAHHPNRQRFSIAHEIGHHQLHPGGTFVDMGINARFRNLESGTGTKAEEREANQFSASLLMPARWVRAAFSELDSFDLGDDSSELQPLAERFRVSIQALTIRLSALDLLKL